MRYFWIFLNLCLVLGLIAAGTLVYLNFDSLLGNPVQGGLASNLGLGAPQEEIEVNLDNAFAFRRKVDAMCQDEAILVVPGQPLRFTLRPVIDLPIDTPKQLADFVETHPDLESKTDFQWKLEGGGNLVTAGEGRFEFVPPEEGGTVLLRFRANLVLPEGASVRGTLSGQTELKLVCPVPWERMPAEEQARIGKYPTIGPNSSLAPYRDFYKRPSHFYEVTEENQHWSVSPHFKLGDFDLHFEYTSPDSPNINWLPQYIALDPHLVVKLESILEVLNSKGVEVGTLGILAGFRSPAYNDWKKKQGGVGGKYTKGLSTHMYGCAADFYVDRDGDGTMDDLNGDGRIDMEDSAWVRDNVVDVVDCQAQGTPSGLSGMCGVYGEHDVPDRSVQSPNLHVDIRGYSINRWYINPRDEMVTDWKYWERKTCAEVLSAT